MNRDHTAAAAVRAERSRCGCSRRRPAAAGIRRTGRLAAGVCQARFASIVLIGWGQAWCGSDERRRRRKLCRSSIRSLSTLLGLAAVFEVPNTTLDKRFCAADCVKSALAVRSYAGCALRTAAATCSARSPSMALPLRALTPKQRAALLLLAQQCVAQAELRARVSRARTALRGSRAPSSRAPSSPRPGQPAAWGRLPIPRSCALLDSAPVAIYHADADEQSELRQSRIPAHFRTGPRAERRTIGRRACIRRTASESRRLGRISAGSRGRCASNTARSRGTAPCASSPNRSFPRTDGSGYVGTISDFTDLVTARGDLHKAETLLRNTFDQAPIGIAYCGSRRQIPALERRRSARCSVSLEPNSRTSPSAN